MPAEVITIPNCESSEQLLNSLKAGCAAEITAVRTIFAACLSKGQYIGFLCKKHDLEQDGSVVKLKKDVITIVYRYDGELVYVTFGYLPPPAELYLWKLYTWPTTVMTLPKDFTRVCNREVFEVLKYVMMQQGYIFTEEELDVKRS